MLISQLLGRTRFRSSEIGQVEHEGRWSASLPAMNRAVIYALRKGECALRVEGEPTIHLREGDVVMLPRGPAYRLFTDEDAPDVAAMDMIRRRPAFTYKLGVGNAPTCSFFAALSTWDDGSRDTVGRILPEVVHVGHNDFDEPGEIDAILDMISREIERAREVSPLLVNNLTNMLLYQVLMVKFGTPQAREALLRSTGTRGVAKALMLIHATLIPDFTVTALAKRVMMSRSALTAEFCEVLGVSPGQYLLNMKMERAANLLETTAYDVNTVADMIGYESTPSFIKAFKQRFGLSPNRYRACKLDDVVTTAAGPPRASESWVFGSVQ